MTAEFEVDVVTRGLDDQLLAISWEWDVPDGFQMMGPAHAERAPRLVVTIEKLEP